MQNEVKAASGGEEKYEITYLCEEGKSVKEAAKVLETAGAKISKETDLGIKKLAYPINKMTTAHYGAILFEIQKTELAKLEKALKLNKTIVRYLIVKELRTPKPKKAKEKVTGEVKIAPKVISEKPAEKTEKVEEKTEVPEIVENKVEPEVKAVEEPVLKKIEEKKIEKVEKEPEVVKEKPQPQPKVNLPVAEKKTIRKKPIKAEFAKEELDKKLEELTLD